MKPIATGRRKPKMSLYGLLTLGLLVLPVMFVSGKLLLTKVVLHPWRSEFGVWNECARGWPWEFQRTLESQSSRAPTILNMQTQFFSPWLIAADVAVLVAGGGATMLFLAWLWRRTGGGRRFSLRGLLLVTTLVAAACGWLAFEQVRWKREQSLTAKLSQQGVDCRFTKYCGPRWLQRLWPADKLVIFHRIVELRDDDAQWPSGLPEQCAQAMQSALTQLPFVNHVTVHSQVAAHLSDPAACSSIEEAYLWARGGEDQALAALGRWPHLRELTIDANQGSDLSDRGLAHLADCPALEELYIPEGDLTAVTDRGIAHLSRAKRLRRLTLPNAPITDASIASFAQMPALESLTVNRCSQLTEQGIRQLAQSKSLKSVVVSDSMQLTDETIRLLKQRLERVTVVSASDLRDY